MTNDYDYLKFENDKDIHKLIENEKLLFSAQVTKINRNNEKQERNFLITDKGIYNLKKKTLKRKMCFSIIMGITVSSLTNEFVIHGSDNEYDYNYISEKRRIIIQIISAAFFTLTKSKIKFCEMKEESLKDYVTLKKEKKTDATFTRMNNLHLIDIDKYLYGNLTKSSTDEKNWNVLGVASIMKNQQIKVIYPEIAVKFKLEEIKILRVVSYSVYGFLFLVEHLVDGILYFMRTFLNNKYDTILVDRNLHEEIEENTECPFFGKIDYFFKTETHFFILSSFEQFKGGFLFYHLNKQGLFSEEVARFYLAQIFCIIVYLHKKGLKTLDIVPENFLLDSKGNIKYIGFEIDRKLKISPDFIVHNPPKEFIPPECRSSDTPHEGSDWYSLGVICYEMLTGHSPCFKGAKVAYPKIISVSEEAKELIEKLLVKDASKRLSSDDIKKASFFPEGEEYFKKIKTMQIKSMLPIVFEENKDPITKYFNNIEDAEILNE